MRLYIRTLSERPAIVCRQRCEKINTPFAAFAFFLYFYMLFYDRSGNCGLSLAGGARQKTNLISK